MIMSDELWTQLLAFRDDCRQITNDQVCVSWDSEGHQFCDGFDRSTISESWALITSGNEHVAGWDRTEIFADKLWIHARPDSDVHRFQALQLYAPICMARIFKPSESFMVVHMAQSIDGMIATEQGNSQWIGNSENLTHAHRLRALVDGVLVGGNTARLDLPGLNVRHVAGPDPARIFLSDSFVDIDKLPHVNGMRTIFLRSESFAEPITGTGSSETIIYDETGGQIDVPKLLASLRQCDVHSILLEGGPQTFHTFFRAGAVDCLHSHIAPMILGSGRSLLDLPKISRLEDSVEVKNPFYVEMGDAVMVIGQL